MRKRAGSWSYFRRHFRPIAPAGVAPEWGPEYLIDPYDAEYQLVKEAEPNQVWTVCQGDYSDKLYIFAGWHFVNRFAYVVTEVPWTDEYDQYLWG
jgi:hypothetical protein